jgi:hypothetical protein
MRARGTASVLRERIGNEATDALSTMMNESNRSMAEEIVRAMGDRFERRLTEEISAVRVEMHEGFGELRAEIANGKTDVIRWAFLFWLGQVGAVGGLLTYLK